MALPDIRTPRFTRSEILEANKDNWPTNGTTLVTMDSYFGCLSAPQLLHGHFVTFSLASKNESMLTELFSHEMRYHELRMFKKDSLIVALWLDNNLMVTCTNCFRIQAPRNHPQPTHLGIDLLGLPPRLSIEDAKIISSMSLEGLKSLCKELGIGSGKIFFLSFPHLLLTYFFII